MSPPSYPNQRALHYAELSLLTPPSLFQAPVPIPISVLSDTKSNQRPSFFPLSIDPYRFRYRVHVFARENSLGADFEKGHGVNDRLKYIQKTLEASPHLRRLGRLFSETVLLDVDGNEFYLAFEKGALTSILRGPSRKTPWRFAFRTDADALEKFWELRPDPGFHDIFGLVKIGRGRVDGDILCLVKNLRFFKDVLALPRIEAKGAS